MPSRHHLFSKGNRSQVSLGSEANDKRVYGESPLHSPAFPPQSAPSPQYDDRGEEQSYTVTYRSEEADFYQLSTGGQPTRSQSQRIPNINTNHPTIHLVGPHSSSSTPSSAIDDNPDRYYQEGPTPPPHKTEPKKRRFFGLGGSSSSSGKDAGKGGGSAISQKGLGRSISVRRKEQVDPQIYADSGYRGSPPQWSKSGRPPEEEDEERGGAGIYTPNQPYTSNPQLPDKGPLKSPALPPTFSHEDYVSATSQQQSEVSSSSTRHPLERQGSHQSSWERTAQQVQKHPRGESASQPNPASYHPSPSSATSTSSHHFTHKSPHEEVSPYYQDQNSRPPSQNSLEPPAPNQRPRTVDFYQSKQERNQSKSATYIQGSMGPPQPPQQPPQNRRSSESAQQGQTASQARDGGVYQPYNQNVQPGQVLPSNAPPQYSGQLAPQGQNYRGNSQPSPMSQGITEQGRSTPPPSRSRDDLSGLDVSQLVARHDELQDKYRKVKKYYFDKDAQVQQLQNTLAHQRLSQSRTSLDDNEYANRFQRLDGAINNLAFNIRRDWRTIPAWLAPHVNRDATTQQTKEMTAVGRACISRWLVDELLERYFHPAIEPTFSAQLKIIEKNLRRFAAPTPSDEEKDALMARISNWRLATLDGLQDALNSPNATEYRSNLTKSLVENLTSCLTSMLKDPPPPGLDGSVNMIMELAVGIASNLPTESRDVYVEYVAPGTLINETIMKIETGLPPLTSPGESMGPEGDTASMISKQTEETGSIESKENGASTGNGNDDAGKQEASIQQQQQQQQSQQQGGQNKKKSMFGGFMNSTGTKKGSISGGPPTQQPPSQQQQQQGQGQQQQQTPPKEDRVRFSTFMAVEVRGRSVLCKAPVYVRE